MQISPCIDCSRPMRSFIKPRNRISVSRYMFQHVYIALNEASCQAHHLTLTRKRATELGSNVQAGDLSRQGQTF